MVVNIGERKRGGGGLRMGKSETSRQGKTLPFLMINKVLHWVVCFFPFFFKVTHNACSLHLVSNF